MRHHQILFRILVLAILVFPGCAFYATNAVHKLGVSKRTLLVDACFLKEKNTLIATGDWNDNGPSHRMYWEGKNVVIPSVTHWHVQPVKQKNENPYRYVILDGRCVGEFAFWSPTSLKHLEVTDSSGFRFKPPVILTKVSSPEPVSHPMRHALQMHAKFKWST